MKKLFYVSLLISLFVLLFAITTNAETYGNLTYTVSNGKVTITDCKESATSVTIPEKINGYPLTQIAAYAFYGCTGLTSITIPDSVTNIGMVAFSHCTSLKSIIFPDSVTYIGENAFYNCTSLEEVHITDIESWFNISFGDFYANPLFYACNGLYIDGKPITSVTIPARGNRIRDYALYNCTSLETITIPDNFVAIGTYAFSGCTSLTSINIPDGVESIGDYAFENCTSLTSITIPDSVTYIGSSAFKYCTSLESITILDSVMYICSSAFENCTSLTSITIPDSVTIVGSNAFRECTSLTSIAIPDSVTSIGFSAFHGCSALEEVTLPFVGNPKDGTSNTHFGYIFGASYYWSNDYYVPTSLKKVTITGGASIGSYAFEGCTSLTSINILDGVESIGGYSFENCTSLTSITIPASVTSIGGYSFENCTSLTSITIPASVTSIGDYVFKNCTNLIKVEFEQDSTLASIGYHAFSQCTSLTSIVIPDGVTNIGSSAFYGCTSLTSITIPQSVTSIGYYAFAYCSNLEEVHITDLAAWFNINFGDLWSNPQYQSNAQLFVNGEEISADMVFSEGITQIPSYIFQNCKNLTSITIPNSITRIGVCAFANCTNLTSIVIPDSITSISSSAFSGCTSLTSIVIPDSITSISSSAFSGCTSLTSIVIPDSVTSISSSAFYNCTSLTSITIPDSVTSIGYEAFYKCSSLEEITLPFVGASATATGYEGVFGYIFGYTTSSSSSTDNGATYQYSSGNTYYHYYIPSSIKKVKITGGTTISGNAFYNCTSLMSITIPDSVTSIGSGTFRGCSGLEEITLPFIGNTKDGTTNTHFGYVFGAQSYSYNDDYIPTSLKKVTITGGTNIGYRAFYNCNGITSITIPNSITSIGSSAFYSCDSLTSITIPASVTSIGSGAFYYCTSLASITIPDGVKSIDGDTFCNCTSLTSITIPASVTSIGLYAFEHCTSLKEVHVTDIKAWLNISFAKYTSNPLNYGGNLYLNDELLTNLIIPDGVTNIGDYAFLKCVSLISVTIPDSVTSIGSSAFFGCTNLEEITLPFVGNTKEGASNTHFGYIFGASSHSYNNDYVPTSLKKVTITGGTKISSSAFYSCNGIVSITAPDSVTSIGDYAFSGCTSLTNINVPARAMSIGNYAFSDCTSLASIIIPNSVTSIGYVAFSGCTSLVSIIIPYGVTNIDSSTFSSCSSLTSITLPNSVTNIAYGAFRGCSSLTSITIPNSVISIGYEVFSGCTSLISICVPNSVTSIGSSAFKNCSNLTSITISDSLTSIGYEVFSGCTSLKSIMIPDRVTSIGRYAFLGCTSLKSIMIPDSVTSINYDAFSGCTSLTCVTVPDSVTSIGSSAFYGCSALEEVTLPFVGNAKYGTSNTHFGYIFGASSYSFNDDYVPRSLKKVTITGGTSVCPYDFYNCTSLTSITILDPVTSIDYCAFKSCSSLTSIAIPNSVKSIDSNVFVDCISLKDVYFDGTRAEWEEINISYGNSYLLNAKLHFTTVNVDSVVLDITSRAMLVGNSFALTATVLPEDADNKTISWESSNASVASVDNGVVTAVSSGTAMITVLTEDGNKTATCIVSVQIPTVSVTDVSLNKSELDLQLGNSETLIATVLPTNATNKNVTWSSSNSNVVSVSLDGVVTAKAVGTAVIIVATADGGKIDSCLVNVSPATVPVTSLSLNKTSATMYVGAVETLITTVAPSNATNKTISWFSSNPSVATVSDGIVTAKTAGTTTITVETVDSLYTATCVVTVKEVYASFKINDITVRPSEKFYVDLVVENSVPIKAMTINNIEYSEVLTLTNAEWLLSDSVLSSVDVSGDSLITFKSAVDPNKAVMRLYFTVDENITDQEAYVRFNAKGTDEENVVFDFVTYEGKISIRNFVIGDCDGDEAITIDDAIHLAFYTFYHDRYPIPNGMDVDFNGDGEVTIDDAIYLAFYTFYPDRYPIN